MIILFFFFGSFDICISFPLSSPRYRAMQFGVYFIASLNEATLDVSHGVIWFCDTFVPEHLLTSFPSSQVTTFNASRLVGDMIRLDEHSQEVAGGW